jgi:hypothetical protein
MVPLFDARSESERSFFLGALIEHPNVGEIIGWDPGRRMLVQGPKVTDKIDLVINGKVGLSAKDNQATFSQHGSPVQLSERKNRRSGIQFVFLHSSKGAQIYDGNLGSQ